MNSPRLQPGVGGKGIIPMALAEILNDVDN
jgi:hypothetical protein